MSKLFVRKLLMLIFLMFLLPTLFAQHRGDNIYFQGLNDITNLSSVKLIALGGTGVGGTSDINSLYTNPAGLSGSSKFQIYIGIGNFESKWWENQDYRPNRQFVTLPFYLDGMYVPNPENNGEWDNKAFFNDSSYIVSEPKIGPDPYSQDAADWVESKDEWALKNIAVAVPFNFASYNFVFAASYNRNNVWDYDRNQTYLDPHIGYTGYGYLPERVTSADDSIRINWYDYQRKRFGEVTQYRFALSSRINDWIKVGLSATVLSGETDDFLSLNKVGYFDLMGGANKFKFSYDTLNNVNSGVSEFNSFNVTLGVIFTFRKLDVGLKFDIPSSITRKYSYENEIYNADINNKTKTRVEGEDEIDIPLNFAVGISYRPVEQFRLAIDYELNPYSESKFALAAQDTAFSGIPDSYSLRFGIEYQLLDFVELLAGYNTYSELFIPDGAPDKKYGPNSNAYSFGLGVSIPYGKINITYAYSILKYYDSYFSNTNYQVRRNQQILLGYTLVF
ncbi:hypothetical protein MROS_1359 [Melioribacter roseus P3M-2]|uniref:Membrane protein involved in aromatic hydrocarbon degradation n=1 Tax=Melioribacter roseus (strain DSM 23840 / JCM 17771 / VKM B-2668 / P3M-2) TaxID=1191523 RepID=I7A3X3_MELRP|nr:hypothetical protein [Melioribacter roseus]AFN74596.1 hypothetical protein MROS_1359 [Melioribacter roseus P3M-2]